MREGMCFLFLPHTSASLVVSENWDPTARADLETYMERIVPEKDRWYTHDLEGPDDATSHIRAMLTDTSLTIPVDDGNLSLGTWQGIYIFEHRVPSAPSQGVDAGIERGIKVKSSNFSPGYPARMSICPSILFKFTIYLSQVTTLLCCTLQKRSRHNIPRKTFCFLAFQNHDASCVISQFHHEFDPQITEFLDTYYLLIVSEISRAVMYQTSPTLTTIM